MAKYGLIPDEFGGGNKYRIIWAPSRMVTLTGIDKTMTVPMYVGRHAIEKVGDYWILEGWIHPRDLYAGTEEDWNANPLMLNTGPYPRRGDYLRRETLSCNPCEANIEKLITWIEAGAQRRSADNVQACQDNLDKELLARKNKRDAILRDAMLAFGHEAMSGYGGGRGTKNFTVTKNNREAGLPGPGEMVTMKPKKRVVYEIPQDY